MEAEGRSTWEILKVLQGVPRGWGDGVLLALRTGLDLIGHNEPSCCEMLVPAPCRSPILRLMATNALLRGSGCFAGPSQLQR